MKYKQGQIKNLTIMILFIVAIILFIPLHIINFIVVVWTYRKKYSFLKTTNGYFRSEALSIDIYGNRAMRTTWNNLLITKEGYQFGVPNETISSALGKNQLRKTLTLTGKILVTILDIIDENHCINSIT